MTEEIVMPQLGESITEGTIDRWLVKFGDKINKYDPLCEVTTDKVVAEVPSVISGTVTEIVVQEGETVEVGAIICRIESEDAATAPIASQSPASTLARSEAECTEVIGADAEQAGRQPFYSQAVLKLIREHNLDLSRLEGTGLSGRITRNDVLELIEREKRQPGDIPKPLVPGERMAVTAIRKSIAKRMAQSKREAPHAWTMIECDVTNLVRYRNQIKEEFKKTEGVPLTCFPFFIKAVAEALKEFPIVNSQWDGDHIIVHKEIHISIAVGTEQALFAPVIKNGDQKNTAQLAKAVHELSQKAREGRLTPEDLTGGTFTVNNTGSFGSVLSAPIINHPQAAIISLEAIVERPVIIDRTVAIRNMVNLCLSMDHRILDGLVCGRFLQSVKRKLEDYVPNTGLY